MAISSLLLRSCLSNVSSAALCGVCMLLCCDRAVEGLVLNFMHARFRLL